ncbi:MAG: GYD domain-containing protein [Candidatus Rokubacteria bacterium]|nr:GYD domain-containing protein [Candidatus Rokubacteria bacterium]
MATYVMLTRLNPEAVKVPQDLKRLERAVADHVRRDCPQVRWISSYALLGPYDYLDLFEAPDEETAARVLVIARSYGHAQTETWTAVPWDRFESLLSTVVVAA